MTQDLVKAIIKTLPKKKIKLHQPIFSGKEKKYFNECINSTFVSSVGPYVDKFERDICKYTKSKYCVLTNSGTSALHVSLCLSNVTTNDEVILPTMAFIAAANAILYCNAIPHFVDSEKTSLGIDPLKLEKWLQKTTKISDEKCINKITGRIIKAIIVVHIFGHSAQIDKINQIAKKYKLIVIEDAAEAFGSFYKGKHLGTFSKFGILSFNGNKIITTGGGGAILINNKANYIKAKNLTTTNKKKHSYNYDYNDIGYNYRMPNINAAVGCAQLEQIKFFLAIKRNIFKNYYKNFQLLSEFELFKEPKNSKSNYWLQCLLIMNTKKYNKNILIDKLIKKGIDARPIWKLLHTVNHLKKFPKSDLSQSIKLEKQIINLPSFFI